MTDPLLGKLETLPCGAQAFWDEIGMRCLDCLAIYGSIGCGCTNRKPTPQEDAP